MEMFTIISGTNRPGSITRKIADYYQNLLIDKGVEAKLFSLENWSFLERSPAFTEVEKNWLMPASRFVFISPEYNGSIPGVLKLMIDLSDHRATWSGKKALLTGVSSGRAGNLRGMDHLTGILNYLGVVVYPNKLPISSVSGLLDEKGNILDAGTRNAIASQVNGFLTF